MALQSAQRVRRYAVDWLLGAIGVSTPAPPPRAGAEQSEGANDQRGAEPDWRAGENENHNHRDGATSAGNS